MSAWITLVLLTVTALFIMGACVYFIVRLLNSGLNRQCPPELTAAELEPLRQHGESRKG